jgi:valyl-tRNA synthetase
MERATERIGARIEAYELAHASLDLYAVFWNEICDWYLELCKPRLYAEDEDRGALSATLLHVLARALTLMHPVLPFVTEEIWSFMPAASGLLAVEPWPAVDATLVDPQAEAVVERAITAITAVRARRDELGVPAGAHVDARIEATGYDETAGQVARLARLELDGAAAGEVAAAVPIPQGRIDLLAGGDLDPGTARERAQVRRRELEAEIARAEGKLANDRFVERAPTAVVQAERDKLADYRRRLSELA